MVNSKELISHMIIKGVGYIPMYQKLGIII